MAMRPFANIDGLRDYYENGGELEPRRQSRWISIAFMVIAAFLLGLALGARLEASEQCIRLKVRPQLMLQRGDINIQTRIQPHADHRAFAIAWNSDNGSEGSSGPTPLEGEHARSLFDLWLHDQPAGNYTFIARVFDSTGHALGSDRQQIHQPDEPAR